MILTTAAVKNETRRHFNCPNALGMQLENNGPDGSSLGSHWEKSILQNDFMTASLSDFDRMYTRFTLAFLKDSNWYDYVNLSMSENTPWGEFKGCDFLNNTCKVRRYPEFNNNTLISGCSFYGHASGNISRTSDPFVEGSCRYLTEYANNDCRNGNYPDLINLGGSFSKDS